MLDDSKHDPHFSIDECKNLWSVAKERGHIDIFSGVWVPMLITEVEQLRAERAASIGEYHWMFPCSKCGRSEYTSHAFTLADGSLGCAWCAVEEARGEQ